MLVNTYAEFLAAKKARIPSWGFDCDPGALPSSLFGFQRHMTAWAVRRGRAAIFADTGLGKSRMQIAWADWVTAVNGRALILAPLAVAAQTIREARALDVDLTYARDQSEAAAGRLVITNYDRLHLFDPAEFTAVVLDESSILKDVTTKTRDALIDAFRDTPYRLACTATPAPNDLTELANHAEFLGVATRREMLSSYFATDLQRGWRVKRHAEADMWRWVASWAVACRMPSDLGYADDGFTLPPLRLLPTLLPVNAAGEGELFAAELGGVSGRARVRRETLDARVQTAVNLARDDTAPWLLWCGLNAEADALAAAIPESVNVHGGMSADDKARHLLGFADGQVRALITKPSVAGWGMNWQHCNRMAFVGLGDSYEAYYQCIRRCWRYGQARPVDVHIVLSELESQIASNVARKEAGARAALDRLIDAQRELQEAS